MMYLKKVTRLFKRRNKSKTSKNTNFYDQSVDRDLFVAEHVDILRDIKHNSNYNKSNKNSDDPKNRKRNRKRKTSKNS